MVSPLLAITARAMFHLRVVLHPTILFTIPPGGHIAAGAAPLSALLRVAPLDLGKSQGDRLGGKIPEGVKIDVADDAVGEGELHELDLLGAGAAQLDDDVVKSSPAAQARASSGEDLSSSFVNRKSEKSARPVAAPPAVLTGLETFCSMPMLQSRISTQPACRLSVLSPSILPILINASNAMNDVPPLWIA
jgi:hypothetical protein